MGLSHNHVFQKMRTVLLSKIGKIIQSKQKTLRMSPKLDFRFLGDLNLVQIKNQYNHTIYGIHGNQPLLSSVVLSVLDSFCSKYCQLI